MTATATAKQIVDTARGFIGRNEAAASHRLFIDLYNEYCVKHGYPRGYRVQYKDSWCDVFVSALFILNNAVDLIGGIECGVEEHVKIFQRIGIWIEDGRITPKSGDIIVFNWDDSTQPNDGYADHIGIVETVEGGQIVTIEGNYSDSVKRRYLAVGDGRIRGYARPRYQSDTQIDCYFVRKNGKTLNSFHILNNAKAEADRNNATVYNADGEVIYTAERYGYVNKDGATVRKKAGAQYRQMRFSPLIKGDKVKILRETKSAAGNKWYQIEFMDGLRGYMWSKRVSLEYIPPQRTKARQAAANAKAIANDAFHGYNNAKGKRGGNPDYACSSFVADCYIKSSVDLGCSCGDVYTKDMRRIFTKHGFKDVTKKVNLRTGEGVLIGDVLVKPGSHTEISVGDGKLAGARGNANSGQPEHGKSGDQGGEIAISGYYYFGQTLCLRYSK